MIDYRKSAMVYMLSNKSGNVSFILQVYGRWAGELMTVPNETVHAIARKFPDFVATPFMIEDGKNHLNRKPARVVAGNAEHLF